MDEMMPWVQRRELHPRSDGYEPSEILSSPLCDIEKAMPSHRLRYFS